MYVRWYRTYQTDYNIFYEVFKETCSQSYTDIFKDKAPLDFLILNTSGCCFYSLVLLSAIYIENNDLIPL